MIAWFVAVVCLVATARMLETDCGVTGKPAKPPRLLPSVGGDVEFTPGADDGSEESTNDGGETGGDSETGDGTADGGGGESDDGGGASGDGSGASDGGSSGTESGSADGDGGIGAGIVDRLLAVWTAATDAVRSAFASVDPIVGFASSAAVDGVQTAQEPDRLYHTFVRSGNIPGLRYQINEYEVIELTLLEAMPALGTLLALPVLAARRTRESLTRLSTLESDRIGPSAFDPRRLSPRRKTDILVVSLATVLTVVYLPRLPLFSMLTVRYLHPVVPLAAYGVCRIPAVRDAASDATRRLAVAYGVSVAVGALVVLAGIVAMDLALGEAVQYHALWNLAAATVCAVAVTGRTLWPERVSAKATATGIALPAGFTTAYLLLAGLVYFRYGTYAFDVVRVVADALPAL
jgi:hypothetical protein